MFFIQTKIRVCAYEIGRFALLGLVMAASGQNNPTAEVNFIDRAVSAKLLNKNIFGGADRKDYILETTGNGALVLDLDGDGDNDILLVNGTRIGVSDPSFLHFYKNDGLGNFTSIAPDSSGLTTSGWGQGVCAGDYDNDGRSDLLITYYGHNVLYHNLGGGKFADVTAAAHLPVTGTRWGAGCTFLDFDRDGYLDLFVSNYVDLDLAKTPKAGQDPSCNWKGLSVMCGPTGLPKANNVLYHNNGDGTFTDVSARAGILKPGGRYGLTAVSADFNNDGWPDIYVACDMTPSLLYENHHDGTFIERGQEAGVAFNADGRLQAGMGVAVADYDANGFLDIAKTNFSGDLPSLFNNEDGKFFTDVSLAAGVGARKLLGWGALFIDVDEDGWPDLMLNNGHVYPEVERAEVGDKYRQLTLLYRNLGNGRFASLEGKAGEGLDVLRPARGMAAGDLDGDGHPEIVIVNMNEAPSLLKNIGTHGNVLLVKLTGTKSNRSAIGARVTVETGSHKQIQEVMSGSGFFSQNDFTLHFGLGTAPKIDRLTVRWPAGAEQEFKDLAPNQTLVIREGALQPQTTPLRKTGG
jgi:hypothetical protein